ncbi:MAG: hypothetical protein JNG85_05780 [Spirochaetaceae bacterium]|nr:hypothetical protein [Spirochaetaceae bacterium]
MKLRFRRFLPFLALLVGILPAIGCATIMRGSDQKIAFQSDPTGAAITVYDEDGMLIANGTTPITIPLKKGGGYFQAAKYRVVFEAPGRANKEIWLSGDLEGGWYIAGNLLLGGFLGWLVVDPLTGAMWNLKPSTLNARLDKAVSTAPDGGLRVVMADQVPPELLAMATPLGSSN